MSTRALLLIAHGSRHPDANADLLHVVAELRRRQPDAIVEAAFLELAEPDIDTGGVRCVEQGADSVVLVPYFLSAGVHVRRDLTAACERLTARFPHVRFRLAEPLGRHPLLIDIVAERVREVEEQFPSAAGPTGTPASSDTTERTGTPAPRDTASGSNR